MAEITGTPDGEPLTGTEDNDVINGLGGADVLNGGSGDDALDGGEGADQMGGGFGNDTYYVDNAGDLIFEGANGGGDTVIASVSHYLHANVDYLTLAAAAGNAYGVGNDLLNIMTGNDGNNLFIAGGSQDLVYGMGGDDSLYGEAGDDFMVGNDGVDYVVGGIGNDDLFGGAGPDALYGESGDDELFGDLQGGTGGDFATDILVGGDGNDRLRGDSGLGDYDLMDGGAGNDHYWVDTGDDRTFEAAGGGTDWVHANLSIANGGVYLYANVENLSLENQTVFGVGNELDNLIQGSELGNWLLGGAGNDTLNGYGGNDVLFGEAGADVFFPSTGADLIGDFTPGVDRIQLGVNSEASFQNLVSRMTEYNGDTAIDLGQGNILVLQGVIIAQLHAADFADSFAPADPEPSMMARIEAVAMEMHSAGAADTSGADLWLAGVFDVPALALRLDGGPSGDMFL